MLLSFGLIALFTDGVRAHGYVQYIIADGVQSLGYDPGFRYQQPPPAVAGWYADNPDIGYVPTTSYNTSDIICHKSSIPGQKYVDVQAGSTITLTWAPTPWPESHVGPLIDYIAPCPADDCTNVSKADLKFVKLAQQGLKPDVISSTNWLKAWIIDDFRNKNSKWDVLIPRDLKSGAYVLRHEIIALHSAWAVNGAQNYPQCINLNVLNGGETEIADGRSATSFYQPDDPGIHFSVYDGLTSYHFPGPKLWR
ncbi:lytic polysaccharide monooxygenase [Cadophora sp. DSE1049]|nr:lytic polysaccharide monooxygenase [Cadophora sp. DSE1049]